MALTLIKAPHATESFYSELAYVDEVFNQELFGGKLPSCLYTLVRKRGVCGYFGADFFEGIDAATEGKKLSEIALNPALISKATLLEVLQTIVHEKCHQYQGLFGTPGKRGYHNKEFAAIMTMVGLQASDTGQPGGKATGQNMADYAIEGGVFLACVERLLRGGWTLSWGGRQFGQGSSGTLGGMVGGLTFGPNGEPIKPAPHVRSKVKYSCASETCKNATWGKPGMRIVCGGTDENPHGPEMMHSS
jgi:hypothetical protein